jgi:hypothetical protein
MSVYFILKKQFMRYQLFTIILSCSIIFTACKQNQNTIKQVNDLTPELEKLWETDSLLTTCESVIYDKNSSIIYVANINEKAWEKDLNGFISKIDTNGNIINLKWVEGLSGPKGMGIFNGKLFVNDIDQIFEIDIESGKVINNYIIEGEPQLNDITVSDDGIIYSSGSNSNTIYALQNGELSELKNTNFDRLNGLLSTSNGLYFIESATNQFGIYNLNNDSITVLTKDVGHGDGIVMLPNNDFIISNWKGEIYYIKSSDWSKKLLLDTKDLNINAADMDFIPEKNLLLVPTFFNNRVVGYKLNFLE